jgi:hypothetical protein
MGVLMVVGLAIEIVIFAWKFATAIIAIPKAIGRIEEKVDSMAKDLAELKKS